MEHSGLSLICCQYNLLYSSHSPTVFITATLFPNFSSPKLTMRYEQVRCVHSTLIFILLSNQYLVIDLLKFEKQWAVLKKRIKGRWRAFCLIEMNSRCYIRLLMTHKTNVLEDNLLMCILHLFKKNLVISIQLSQ